MSRQEIIEKIRKLLSLSSSPNQNEAERAAEMARRLIEEWQVNASELEKGPIEDYEHSIGKKKIQTWETLLMNSVSRNNFCKAILKPGGYHRDDAFVVIGRTVNVIAAIEMYVFLEKLAQREWKRWMKDPANRRKKKDRNKFLLGFSAAVATRMNRDSSLRWSEDPAGKSLVASFDHEEQAIDEYIGQKWQTNQTSIKLKNQGALKNGATIGFNTSLSRQMREKQLRIGAGTTGGM